MGWNILLIACFAVLILFMDSVSDAAETKMLLIALVACPVAAALPTLFYSRKHPEWWLFCTTVFHWLVAAFFYYLICVWIVLIKATMGQELPDWVQIWLPSTM